MKISILLTVIGLAFDPGKTVYGQNSQPDSGAITGIWLTAEGKARVQITRSGDVYSGKIIWLKEPDEDGKPKVDKKNPDVHLRARPIIGLEIVYGFGFDEDNEWTGGRVYDPESGNEYKAKMTLVDEKTLKLRGYILIPLLGRSEVWTRE